MPQEGQSHSVALARWMFRITGAVQGVGFRPFVYRAATALGLRGWVANGPDGVTLDVEGPIEQLRALETQLRQHPPPFAHIASMHIQRWAESAGPAKGFEIRASLSTSLGLVPQAEILPDMASCAACVGELFDPSDRRYRYPFINCTHCGPRYTIIEGLPYDRARTTMRHFEMCEACRAEYHDPAHRRFHAQPIACPACGPRLALLSPAGEVLAQGAAAFERAVDSVRSGDILALKSTGGFQLVVDAEQTDALGRLRTRKRRPHKPFALMMHTLEDVRRHCVVSQKEAELWASRARPIVLLRKRDGVELVGVAPDVHELGAMGPSTPLHHLLLSELARPLVVTSGNAPGDVICTGDSEALHGLASVADAFLTHDRAIAHHADDSVLRVIASRPMMVRRARGYAPSPLRLERALEESALGVGAHQKSAIALGEGHRVTVAPHIGDLDAPSTRCAFEKSIAHLMSTLHIKPARVVVDAHPDYASRHEGERLARSLSRPLHEVQHHHAHVLACMAEHGLQGPVLGVVWDGTGYGEDGTVWGGEFLRVERAGYERLGHLRRFALPGGAAAVREPRRCALGLLYELYGDDVERLSRLPFEARELGLLRVALGRGLQSPRTSSMGRLFDGMASLLGLCHTMTYEGQAARRLESEAWSSREGGVQRFRIVQERDGVFAADWSPVVEGVLRGEVGAWGFHEALVELIVDVVERCGLEDVVLSGGCFQNARLTERALARLHGVRVWTPMWWPPNDGGMALGQVYAERPCSGGVAHVFGDPGTGCGD